MVDQTSAYNNVLTVTGKSNQTYVYGLGAISVEIEKNNGTGRSHKYYYTEDYQGSPVELTDSRGRTVAEYDYDAAGNMSVWYAAGSKDAADQILGYTGYQYDRQTGLYYAQARYYDATTGRFISEDGTKDGDNWYTYCANDPINYVDPSGEVILGTLLKAAGGGAVDFMIQLLCNYLFNPDTQFDFGKAIKATDWVQVAASAVESAIPWGKSKLIKYVGAGAISAVSDTVNCILKSNGDITFEQGFQTFAVGFVSGVAGAFMGDVLSEYGTSAIKKGLKKLGLSDEKVAKLVGDTVDTGSDKSDSTLKNFMQDNRGTVDLNALSKSGTASKGKTLNEWLKNDVDLLDECTDWYRNNPEWWGIDPEKTDVFYRTPDEVKVIRSKPGESGGHHPHGLALGGPEGQKLTITGETAKIKNPMHSKVTGLQRRVINKIKKRLK